MNHFVEPLIKIQTGSLMKTHEEELQQIKGLLRDHPKGLKITRIARELAMNRNAAAKFLEILLMTGQVEAVEHGMSKIFILSRRISIPTMLDRSDDLILILDKDMKISSVNENYLVFTGLKREDILGKRPDLISLPLIGTRPLFDRIRESHFGADIRTEIREIIDKKEFFFDVRLTPTVFNDGTRGITIIIGNITHEKKVLESVSDEKRTLVEGILACIDDAVILMDSGMATILFANPAALRMFDLSRRDIVGKNLGVLIDYRSMTPQYSGSLNNAFMKQGYFETESRLKRNGNGESRVNLHLRPIYNSHGEVSNIVMVIRNTNLYPVPIEGVFHYDASNLRIPPYPGIISYGSPSL
jgi:PAS domain S-box-containing protein